MINNPDMNDLQLEDVEDYSADYPPAGFPHSEENIHTAGSDISIDNDKNYRRSKLISVIRGNKWLWGLMFIVFIILIVIIAVAAGGDKAPYKDPSVTLPSASDSASHQPPITVDPNSLDPEVTVPLMESLIGAYSRHNLDASVLDEANGETPQRKAFYWMATDKNLDKLDHTQKMQRFALAVFYYSTNAVPTDYSDKPKSWVSAHLWLSKAHACEWKGVVCNGQQHVQGIDLERNNLTGKLPLELVILANKLISLDLTSNLIHMRGGDWDVFKPLVNIETLLMDDNYLETSTGLPPQFRHLTKVQKIRLSYNLFSGELEVDHKIFGELTQLTHLEIESNFLSGNVPAVLGELEELVYLYLRRNELTFNLDFLKTGKLQNMFALWLDSNTITGTIPTEIGLMTELASVSMTNATLTGSIPTEIGNLKALRRLWLYSNQLTGPIPAQLGNLDLLEVFEVHHNKLKGAMPQGVCLSVEKSAYEYKSLTSDCNGDAFVCDTGCCTKCFD